MKAFEEKIANFASKYERRINPSAIETLIYECELSRSMGVLEAHELLFLEQMFDKCVMKKDFNVSYEERSRLEDMASKYSYSDNSLEGVDDMLTGIYGEY